MLRLSLISLLACLTGIFAAQAESTTQSTSATETAEQTVLGWLEFVYVEGADLRLDAKLDTGAKTSSIHAVILDSPARDEFRADEVQTIVFRLVNEDGETRQVSAPIARWAAIKKKTGGVLHRPVVDMTFCLGGVTVTGEVTLADRGNFNYETLIGRNMLKAANLLVNPSEIYTKRARCD